MNLWNKLRALFAHKHKWLYRRHGKLAISKTCRCGYTLPVKHRPPKQPELPL